MKLKLVEKKPEVQDVISFILDPEKEISWEPGQYLHYILPHPDEDERGTGRWFTISSAPFEKHAMITTRFNNEHSSTFKKALKALEPGQTIESDDGPKGFFVIKPEATKHIFIAGGIGITPFRSMLVQLDHDKQPIPVELLYANKDDVFVFNEELNDIAQRHPEFHITKYVGDQRIQKEDVKAYVEDIGAMFYLSGPKPMVENYQHMLSEMGVAEARILTDYFPGY